MLQLPNQRMSQDAQEHTTEQQQQLVLKLTEPTTEVTKFFVFPKLDDSNLVPDSFLKPSKVYRHTVTTGNGNSLHFSNQVKRTHSQSTNVCVFCSVNCYIQDNLFRSNLINWRSFWHISLHSIKCQQERKLN